MKSVQKDKGTVTEFTIEAPQLGREKTVWVYLPYNYEVQQQFSVIYMHDGQNVFDHAESFKREWHLEEKLNDLHSEAIIVGIEHGGDKHRIDEMTPYPNDTHGGGHADNYLDFIVNTLKPYVDANFKTFTDRDNTTIFGSSVGGLISFYALLKFPDVFGNAGVFSPSFWFNKQEIFALMEQTKTFKTKVYFLCGNNEGNDDMVKDVNEMNYQINTKRCECKMQNKKVIVKGGQHNEKLWREGFKKAYLWLF